MGVGLALVIGTVESFIEKPKGDALPLFAGVGLIVLAMVMSAISHSKLPHSAGKNPLRGVIFSGIAGCVMGFFYPQLMRSISPEPGGLTPYVALVFFGIVLMLAGYTSGLILIGAATQ